MAGEPVLLTHPSSLDHDPGPHPEQPARITAIREAVWAAGGLGFVGRESPEVDRSVLEAVHSAGYVAELEALCLAGGGAVDPDTAVSRGSFAAALHGSGGAVALAEMLVARQASTGFSAHRPPGHHALPGRAMGFCLFNHVAVAATHALEQLGVDRVLVLDWDVHHGNGTHDIFVESDRVLFVSIHQWPLYPGTGAATEVGRGKGEGFTVNLPVPPGSGDREFVGLVSHVVVPLVRAFEPELVLLSAGYDAHVDDPLADCRVTDGGYAAMARLMTKVGREIGAPVGGVLEGGYALDALARSVVATLRELGGAGHADDAAVDAGPLEQSALERLRRWWSI